MLEVALTFRDRDLEQMRNQEASNEMWRRNKGLRG